MRCLVFGVTLRLLVINISSSSPAVKLSQHRRLLPAMCHNLRDGGRGPPATVLTTPGLLTAGSKPDIGSESRFLPTPPAFDAPVMGVPVGILPCRLELKI